MAAGFVCEFVEEPQREFQCECPICLLVLREPYQATCCGKSFCRECIERVKDKVSSCPACKVENFNLYHNKGLQQSLYDFQVYCSSRDEGCEWRGELRELDKHLNSEQAADKSLEGCPFTVISCPLGYCGCLVKLPRKDMKDHLQKEGVQHMLLQARKQQLLLVAMENLHQENQKLRTVAREIEGERRYLEQRLADFETKMGIPTTPYRQPTTAVEFVVKDFESKAINHTPWYSPPFYTHTQGYKMCLKINVGGSGQGKGTHLSVYVHVMRGEFDHYLKWPFLGHIATQMVDQLRDEDHFNHTFHFTDAVPVDVRDRQKDRERSKNGRGPSKFFLLSELQPKYLRNDCLVFRIVKVELK